MDNLDFESQETEHTYMKAFQINDVINPVPKQINISEKTNLKHLNESSANEVDNEESCNGMNYLKQEIESLQQKTENLQKENEKLKSKK